jgi:hypothetical protein
LRLSPGRSLNYHAFVVLAADKSKQGGHGQVLAAQHLQGGPEIPGILQNSADMEKHRVARAADRLGTGHRIEHDGKAPRR